MTAYERAIMKLQFIGKLASDLQEGDIFYIDDDSADPLFLQVASPIDDVQRGNATFRYFESVCLNEVHTYYDQISYLGEGEATGLIDKNPVFILTTSETQPQDKLMSQLNSLIQQKRDVIAQSIKLDLEKAHIENAITRVTRALAGMTPEDHWVIFKTDQLAQGRVPFIDKADASIAKNACPICATEREGRGFCSGDITDFKYRAYSVCGSCGFYEVF